MYPMPMNLAVQLVAERRARLEATADRRRLRRLVSRRGAEDAPSTTPLARRAPVTIAGRRAGTTDPERVRTVA